MAMHRKHFKALAETLTDIYRSLMQSNSWDTLRDSIFNEMIIFCITQNPKFREDLFREHFTSLLDEQRQAKKDALTKRQNKKKGEDDSLPNE